MSMELVTKKQHVLARSIVESPATPDHYGDLWGVPMSDLLTGNRQYCLDKAADCERKAAQARHPDAAKEFQSIAARWRVAAATRDFTQKVEALTDPSSGRIIMMSWMGRRARSNLALSQALRDRNAMGVCCCVQTIANWSVSCARAAWVRDRQW